VVAARHESGFKAAVALAKEEPFEAVADENEGAGAGVDTCLADARDDFGCLNGTCEGKLMVLMDVER
jgi:hypothetical protein